MDDQLQSRPPEQVVSKDKPQETASDVYRFQLKVPAGETKVLTVTEERQFGETIAVLNRNDDQLRFFISQPFASAGLKKGSGAHLRSSRQIARSALSPALRT